MALFSDESKRWSLEMHLFFADIQYRKQVYLGRPNATLNVMEFQYVLPNSQNNQNSPASAHAPLEHCKPVFCRTVAVYRIVELFFCANAYFFNAVHRDLKLRKCKLLLSL